MEEKDKNMEEIWRRIMGPVPNFTLTKLKPEEETRFRSYMQSRGQLEDIDNPMYDYRGTFHENLQPKNPGENWIDGGRKLFKNPNHPTYFRTEFARKFGEILPDTDIDNSTKEDLFNLIMDKGGVVLMPRKK